MKQVILTLALAIAVLGGGVALSTVSSTHVAACQNGGC
jgi:hypothetical protein